MVRVGSAVGHDSRWRSILFTYLPTTPDFSVYETAEEVVAGDAVEVGVAEGGLWIGKAGDAQAGEDAEDKVERADVEGGERAKDAGVGLAEVGDEPEGSGLELGGDALGESVDFGLGEAVEKEMGCDEIGG
jgi:hypothetical protein